MFKQNVYVFCWLRFQIEKKKRKRKWTGDYIEYFFFNSPHRYSWKSGFILVMFLASFAWTSERLYSVAFYLLMEVIVFSFPPSSCMIWGIKMQHFIQVPRLSLSCSFPFFWERGWALIKLPAQKCRWGEGGGGERWLTSKGVSNQVEPFLNFPSTIFFFCKLGWRLR